MIEENRAEFAKANVIRYHNEGILGEGITVAVLDDEGEPRAHMKDFAVLPFNNHNGIGHKTNVASVIHELLPKAKVVMLNSYGKHSNRLECYEWIRDNKPDLVNISYSLAITNGLDILERTDIPIVCAAGNQGNDKKLSIPARYPWTIAVGAMYEGTNAVAGYSNAGPELDCVGFTNIHVPSNEGYKRTFDFTGTSCATPFVVGMLGLYLCWRKTKGLPALTREEVKAFIHRNCKDYYEPGHDYKSGHGLFVLPDPVIPLELIVGSRAYYLYGKEMQMDTVPTIDNAWRTMVPLRFIAEGLGRKITPIYDSKGLTKRVIIE